MRLFVAVDFSPGEKMVFSSNADVLKNEGVRGNFSRSDNYHITLAFLGEVEKSELGKLKNALNFIAFKPFELSVKGMRCFRDIMVMNIESESRIDVLAKEVRNSLSGSGFEYDKKPFKAHMTIAREVIIPKGKSISALSELLKPCTTMVKEIILFESTRLNGKLVYRKLFSKSGQLLGD